MSKLNLFFFFQIHKGKTMFTYFDPHQQSEHAGKKDHGMMEPFQNTKLSKPKSHLEMHRKHMTPGQKDGMWEPFHHKDLSKHFKMPPMHMTPVKVEQDVEVDEKHYERIHMPKFSNFRETLVLHDFTRASVFDDHAVFSSSCF